ncbi:Ger(x)C family spore germination protein [Alteribacillus bidgolensis]|uniref:Spore germination protein KC n=1 Tax=Alteribacillus bidgolensis TaxID=930129 RepID=A0A1G8FX56_9BACI|nr:Ger(x)C family spore germination protein [Alteribacillus bidgolensis]SDH86729.1 spore germination protein KC [Alteribacillus bidgolensis]
MFIKIVKTTLPFYLCLCALFLSGCWDRQEVNDLALVLATAIDKTDDNKIELSIQMVVPKSMGGGQQGSGGEGKTTTIKKATGTTIYQAMTKLQEKVPRYIFWGQNQMIIFGEKLAKEGIGKYIDFFARHPSQRIRSYIFVHEGKAIDVLDLTPGLEQMSMEVPRELARLEFGLNVTLRELLVMLGTESKSVAVPSIKVSKEPDRTLGIHLSGAAVLKNNKLTGFINNEITQGVMWLRDEIKSSSVTIKPQNADDLISFNLIRYDSELKPVIEDGKWKMIVKIVTEEEVVDNQTTLNLIDHKVAKSLEEQISNNIDKRIRLTLEQVQKKMRADVFGFAEEFHQKYPDEWSKVKNQWDELLYPELEVEIDIKTYIRRPGMSTENYKE